MHVFQQSYHVPGTLAADITITFTAPFDCTLIEVSACNSAAAAGGLIIGTAADTDAHLTTCSIGVSGTPVTKKRANFVGSQYPRISAGDVIVATLDYNYNGGGGASASADYTLVLTFEKG